MRLTCGNPGCPSENLYRGGRCQTCYRYYSKNKVDRTISPATWRRLWLQSRERDVIRNFFHAIAE